jgi:hypothetical protein
MFGRIGHRPLTSPSELSDDFRRGSDEHREGQLVETHEKFPVDKGHRKV